MASDDNPDQLLIALEPEAASIYCRRLRMHQLVPDRALIECQRHKYIQGVEELHDSFCAGFQCAGDFTLGKLLNKPGLPFYRLS